MKSSLISSTLSLSLLASLALAAPSEPAQSGASQNSGISQQELNLFGFLTGPEGGGILKTLRPTNSVQ